MKGNSQRKNIIRELARYKKYDASLAGKSAFTVHRSFTPLPVVAPSKQEEILPQFRKRKRGDAYLCVCGKIINRTQKLCTECRIGAKTLSTTDGVKFIPPTYKIKLEKKTGKICRHEQCKVLTERLDGYCYIHCKKISKSIKYRTNIPKNVGLNGRPLSKS